MVEFGRTDFFLVSPRNLECNKIVQSCISVSELRLTVIHMTRKAKYTEPYIHKMPIRTLRP